MKANITVSGATYNTADVLSYKDFAAFKANAAAQIAANPQAGTLHFAHWGEGQEGKLKEVWDAAQATQPAAPKADPKK